MLYSIVNLLYMRDVTRIALEVIFIFLNQLRGTYS